MAGTLQKYEDPRVKIKTKTMFQPNDDPIAILLLQENSVNRLRQPIEESNKIKVVLSKNKDENDIQQSQQQNAEQNVTIPSANSHMNDSLLGYKKPEKRYYMQIVIKKRSITLQIESGHCTQYKTAQGNLNH
ncbi:hypothetical protein HELRODRAFT_162889 [Helobdella robusta]|uniref:Uncharacterized protein n=1 Tax=Helobdella robusta TaxID=6412 RepID=T1ETB7_HELRO|nr:hypothetical protein HELRODRAFT_162889 [Helobdella robusta]ESN99356.1 hypothetical protein HELRODRAFT_162889 [Helobdella robusta]